MDDDEHGHPNQFIGIHPWFILSEMAALRTGTKSLATYALCGFKRSRKLTGRRLRPLVVPKEPYYAGCAAYAEASLTGDST